MVAPTRMRFKLSSHHSSVFVASGHPPPPSHSFVQGGSVFNEGGNVTIRSCIVSSNSNDPIYQTGGILALSAIVNRGRTVLAGGKLLLFCTPNIFPQIDSTSISIHSSASIFKVCGGRDTIDWGGVAGNKVQNSLVDYYSVPYPKCSTICTASAQDITRGSGGNASTVGEARDLLARAVVGKMMVIHITGTRQSWKFLADYHHSGYDPHSALTIHPEILLTLRGVLGPGGERPVLDGHGSTSNLQRHIHNRGTLVLENLELIGGQIQVRLCAQLCLIVYCCT